MGLGWISFDFREVGLASSIGFRGREPEVMSSDFGENGNLVWNFKNDLGRVGEEAHQAALEEVVGLMERLLKRYFNPDLLAKFTLVCVPASSKEKTVGRFRNFAEGLCQRTGMADGFDFVEVTWGEAGGGPCG